MQFLFAVEGLFECTEAGTSLRRETPHPLIPAQIIDMRVMYTGGLHIQISGMQTHRIFRRSFSCSILLSHWHIR